MADLMNPGGGLTKSKLLLADANPGDVVSPKKFYSNGNKEIQTGTLSEMPAISRAIGVGNDGNDVLFTMQRGVYRTNNSTYNAPEIRETKSSVMQYGLGMNPSVSYTFSGTCTANGYTLASASANGTIKIPGLPYARMTTSNADGCSASYSNGTLTVTINEYTGEVSGYGNVQRTTNWSITCNMYMT